MPRLSAIHILRQTLERGTPLDEALAADRRFPDLSGPDRALCRHIVATTIRRRGQIDAIIDTCLETPLPDRASGVRQILRAGACQILFMETPDYAAVDTAVRLTGDIKAGNFRRLVNGVLRRIGRDGIAWRDAQDAARLNTPDWLWNSWTESYGEETCRQIAEAHLKEPPLDLTVKLDLSVKDEVEKWRETLDAYRLPNDSLRLRGAGRIEELPGFSEGAWWVQDAAAALPAKLLAPRPGDQVIDLCAAPGGKTAQLAAAGAEVTAVDRSKPRMDRLEQNLDRLRLKATRVVADAAKWRPEQPADAVLLDAPCTATGTIRRHPDIAWLKSPKDVGSTARVQRRLLTSAVDMLRSGGTLIYAVCSLESGEGEAMIDEFIRDDGRTARVPITADECGGLGSNVTDAGDLRILPSHWAEWGGVDGFFVARLRKSV